MVADPGFGNGGGGIRAGEKYRNAEIPALSYRKNTENTEFLVYRDFRYGMIPYRKIPVR